jgi:hypothetical protein
MDPLQQSQSLACLKRLLYEVVSQAVKHGKRVVILKGETGGLVVIIAVGSSDFYRKP